MKHLSCFQWKHCLLAVIVLAGHAVVGVRVKFYEGKNYTGLLTELELNEETSKGCIPLLNSNNDTGLSINSLKTSRCLILYNAPNCHSFFDIIGHPSNWPDDNCDEHSRCKSTFPFSSFRAQKNEVDISLLNDGESSQFVSSFHFCSHKLGGGPNPKLTIYEASRYRGSPVETFGNLCGCRNLPYYRDDGLSRELWFDNHGNSFDLFENENCQGRSKSLRAGMGFNSLNVWKDGIVKPSTLDEMFTQNAYGWERLQFERTRQPKQWGGNDFLFKSVRPSGNPKCVQLDATIHKFHIRNTTHPGDNENLGKETKLQKDVTWINYRDSNITKEYSLLKNLTSQLEFGMVSALREMKSAVTDGNATMETDIGVPFFYTNHQMLSIFKNQYTWPTTTGSNTNNSRTIITSHDSISYHPKFEVPPCSVCKVSSFMKWSENHPIEYTVLAKVKGEADGEDVDSATLIKHLPFGLKHAKILDENSVEVTASGTMFAHAATEAYLKVWCTPIKNCKTNQSKHDNVTVHLQIQQSVKNQERNDTQPEEAVESEEALTFAKLGNYIEAINKLRKVLDDKYQIEDFIGELYDGKMENTKHCLNLLSYFNCTEYGNGVSTLFKAMETSGDLAIRSIFTLEWYLNNSTCANNEFVSETMSDLQMYTEAATSYWESEIENGELQVILDFANLGELERVIVESKVENFDVDIDPGFDAAHVNDTEISLDDEPDFNSLEMESILPRENLTDLILFSGLNSSHPLILHTAEQFNGEENISSDETMLLAYHICSHAHAQNKTEQEKSEVYQLASAYIPNEIQNLFWKSTCTIKNVQRNEFLHAEDNSSNENDSVFTIASGSSQNDDATRWRQESTLENNGQLFFRFRGENQNNQSFYLCENKVTERVTLCQDDIMGYVDWVLKPTPSQNGTMAFGIKNSEYEKSEDYLKVGMNFASSSRMKRHVETASFVDESSQWVIECA